VYDSLRHVAYQLLDAPYLRTAVTDQLAGDE
jgi:hypothetical protein